LFCPKTQNEIRPDKPFLLEETPESLTTKLKEAGQPAFRAKQVLDWVYKSSLSTLTK
jgi:23S rRNA (adenine2503-C2)-methyltransferase